jgi:cytochrome c-type biogenesis protein CcmH
MKKYWMFFLLMLVTFTAIAEEASQLATDPAIEARLKAMSTELRCLVCQNQTLADSNAPLAEDLRREIRLQLHAGKSDQEVIDYLVSRYGDFVLYKPPFKSSTALLWIGPFVLMLAGLAGLLLMLRRRQKPNLDAVAEAPLSADEARKVQELLSKD